MERITRFRARVLLIIFVAALVLYAFRLYDIQIIATGGQGDNATVFITQTSVKAARGEILDRNGNVLVGNRAGYKLMLNHFVILSADGTYDHLYRLAKRCQEEGIDFSADVVLSQKIREEQVFALILSNALDNAFHAQADLPEGKRSIRLLLKNSNGKLLLHLRNRCGKPPVFVEGMPQSQRGPGHGYGTQSIRFAAERLGGNCRFSMEEGDFLLRVII